MKYQLLILSTLSLVLGSCLKNEPITNDSDKPINFLEIQKDLYNATNSETPEDIKLNDFVYFSENVRFFNGKFQTVGYKTHQALEKNDDTLVLEDGTQVPLHKFKFLESIYKVDEAGNATLDTRTEKPCRFVRSPYFLWLESCDLQPFQDYYLYVLYTQENLPYFFNYKKRNLQVKLPPLMVEKNNCFGNANCMINVSEIEFDIIFNESGKRKRQHILLWLTKDLPYLASNPKKCISTLLEHEGQKYPYDFCQELVNFIQE
jgi:hypothetical protein